MNETIYNPPQEFPAAFNGTGRHMLHPRIAIWSHLRNDYQIYQVNRETWPAIHLIPVTTERGSPFYFAEGPGDDQSRTMTLYRPRARIHSHIDMAIWHTGGWLCRRNQTHLVPVLPLLGVSDPGKLPWGVNVGIHPNREYQDWLRFQNAAYYRPIIHNRMQVVLLKTVETPTIPTPVPLFVAEALLERAERAEECCAISMEPLRKGDAVVTSCFHLFQREALETWMQDHCTCPVCKTTCNVTHC